MGRELNRELFGQSENLDARLAPQTAVMPSTAGLAKVDDLRVFHLHVENLSKRMMELESRVEIMQSKTDDMMNQNKQRFERVQGHFQNQGEMVKSGFADVNMKIAQVVSRVNERRVSEGAVKEMVDRHSHAVQNFEVRMTQLQRVLSEQELQLMNARTELKEALLEIARLKKL